MEMKNVFCLHCWAACHCQHK